MSWDSVGKSLSDNEIIKLMKGKIKIIPYPEIHQYQSIDQLLSPYGQVILLYETKPNYGHYVLVMKRSKNDVEVFDSYGKYRPDDELNFIDPIFRKKSSQDYPYLTSLLYKSGYRIEYNNHHLQSTSPNVRTCGRYAIVRSLLKNLNVDQFAQLLKSDPVLTPDQIVTDVTSWLAKLLL